jgi:hypothetical protein
VSHARGFVSLLLLAALAAGPTGCTRTPSAGSGAPAPAAAAPAPSAAPPPSAPAAPKPAAARAPFSIATQGSAHSLRFDGGGFAFCDKRGAIKVDLAAATSAPSADHCGAPREASSACDNPSGTISTRNPPNEPNDIVDLDGWSVPLSGHVQDCVVEGKTLAVATGSTVVLVDGVRESTKELSRDGADRVSLGAGWVAWASGARIYFAPR